MIDVRQGINTMQSGSSPGLAKTNTDALDRFKERVDAVLEVTDIVALIDPFIEGGLRAQGNSFVGLCPFHNDTSPSFSVTPSKGVYRCWSCSAGMNGSSGGNAITFVRRYFDYSYREACEMLAQQAGIPLRDEKGERSLNRSQFQFDEKIAQARALHAQRRAAFAQTQAEPTYQSSADAQRFMINQANKAYRRALVSHPEARDYLLNDRQLPLQSLGRFQIGYAPDAFDFLSNHFDPYSQENTALVESGLVRAAEHRHNHVYDTFRQRILFTVHDEQGRPVGFGGRLLGDGKYTDKSGQVHQLPKYINSPESAIFKKSELLFGLYENKTPIQHQKQAIVVEGYMDVVGLAAAGVDNAVACMGVALTSEHVQALSRYANEVVICFDGDAAGEQAAMRSLMGLLPHLDNQAMGARFLLLEGGVDPDEFVKAHGRDAFESAVQRALPVVDFIDQSIHRLEKENGSEQTDRMLQQWLELAVEGSPVHAHLAQHQSQREQKKQAAHKKAQQPAARPTSRFHRSARQSSQVSASIAAAQQAQHNSQARMEKAIERAPHAALRAVDHFYECAQQLPSESAALMTQWVQWFEGRAKMELNQSTVHDTEDLDRRAAPFFKSLSQVLEHIATQGTPAPALTATNQAYQTLSAPAPQMK